MDDLVTWLRAQLDEDERVAQSLDDYDEYSNHLTVGTCMGFPCERYLSIGKLRVLAEVDAKRRILDLAEATAQHETMNAGYDTVARLKKSLAKVTAPELERVLRLLALPYADRPGYQQEWR